MSSSFLSEDDLKPPPYSECAQGDEANAPHPSRDTPLITEGGNSVSISEAPPPYTLSPPAVVSQQDSPLNHSESLPESRPT